MAIRPRSALVGGIAAVGMTALAAVAVQLWTIRTANPSGCPRALVRAAPSTLEDASRLISVCSGDDVQTRLRAATLADVVSYRSKELPPAAWLARDSPLHRHLSALGFECADDMSFAVLSAAWHRARGLTFDATATADCLRAWNRKMRLWVESVPPGSPVPAPEFGCASLEEIEKGRHLWPKP